MRKLIFFWQFREKSFLEICVFCIFLLSASFLNASSLEEITNENQLALTSIHHNNESIPTIVIAHRISSKDMLINYVHYVEEIVAEHKFYPPLAKTMGHEGHCVLQFSIKRDGTIADLVVLEPSYSTLLNQAALEILARIGSFKTFPKRLKDSSVLINIPIRYTLKGS